MARDGRLEKNMVKKLIRCTQCNQVIHLYEGFGDFGETPDLPDIEWSSEDLNSQKEFFHDHKSHAIEEIFVDPDTSISDKPCYEPTKTIYFETSNGRQKFLIRRTKLALDQPACYEIIPGRLQVSNVSCRIQENDLRKQLSLQNGAAPLPEEIVKKFIQAFQEEVESIPPEKLFQEVEEIQEGDTPLLVYGSLKEAHWKSVLQRCQQYFQKPELLKIMHFIRDNKNPEDVLALLIKRDMAILDHKTE